MVEDMQRILRVSDSKQGLRSPGNVPVVSSVGSRVGWQKNGRHGWWGLNGDAEVICSFPKGCERAGLQLPLFWHQRLCNGFRIL